jgi:hypothetical protein
MPGSLKRIGLSFFHHIKVISEHIIDCALSTIKEGYNICMMSFMGWVTVTLDVKLHMRYRVENIQPQLQSKG